MEPVSSFVCLPISKMCIILLIQLKNVSKDRAGSRKRERSNTNITTYAMLYKLSVALGFSLYRFLIIQLNSFEVMYLCCCILRTYFVQFIFRTIILDTSVELYFNRAFFHPETSILVNKSFKLPAESEFPIGLI